jgi:hypothetical protein
MFLWAENVDELEINKLVIVVTESPLESCHLREQEGCGIIV